MKNGWHAMPIADVERTLKTNIEGGLSMHKARERLANEHKSQGGKRKYLFAPSESSLLKCAFSAVIDPCMMLLIAFALLSVLFGASVQGLLTLGVAILCCVISVVMSYTSLKRLRAVADYSSPVIRVLRGGDKYYTDGRNVVVGDVILLCEGDLLPCDARIVDSSDLVVKELIQTANGIKNRVVDKDYKLRYLKDDPVTAPNAKNMLYAGSAVLSGSAKAIVTETGKNVYLAPFASEGELSKFDKSTILERSASRIVKLIRMVSVCAVLLLTLVSLITSDSAKFADNFMLFVSCLTLVSCEVLTIGINYVYSSYLHKLSKAKKHKGGRGGDLSANVKSIGVLDKLNNITSLVIAGRSGLTEGAYRISQVYTADGQLGTLSTDNPQGNRLLSLVYTYIKTLLTSKDENDAVSGDIATALDEHVKASGFDFAAMDIYLRSLYYVNDGTCGYACAETANSTFRVTLTPDKSVLDFCTFIRRSEEPQAISEIDIDNAVSFCDEAENKGAVCLYAVSENNGEATLEAIITLEQPAIDGFDYTVSQLDSLGISTCLFFERESDVVLLSDLGVGERFRGKIALASDVSVNVASLEYKNYCVFAGYTREQHSAILDSMIQNGERVAVLSIDNENNALISHANVAVSCDILRYDTDKHKASAYASLPRSGKDTNIRCSSQTRLFSGIILKRAHSQGGGISSLVNVAKTARMAKLSVNHALSLSIRLLCSLLPFVVVSAFSGATLISAFMMLALAAMSVLLPFAMFTETDYKQTSIYSFENYSSKKAQSSFFVSVILRIALSTVAAITLVVLGALGVFGKTPSFSVAVFVSMLLVTFVEALAFDVLNTVRGEGRVRRLTKLVVAYAAMLCICGVATQDMFISSLFPGGIGTYEFLLIPVYILCYTVIILLQNFTGKKGNKI